MLTRFRCVQIFLLKHLAGVPGQTPRVEGNYLVLLVTFLTPDLLRIEKEKKKKAESAKSSKRAKKAVRPTAMGPQNKHEQISVRHFYGKRAMGAKKTEML